MRSMSLLISLVLLGGCAGSKNGADVIEIDAPIEYPVEKAQHYLLDSNINNKAYRLSVLLPDDYDSQSSYPTFYVYDAVGERFLQLIQLAQALGDASPPLIWIGMGPGSDAHWDAQRNSDLTPTSGDQGLVGSSASSEITPISGGAPQMLSVLTGEIIPFIQRNYSTNNVKAIGGHSFAGLFAAYAFLEQPNIFDKILLASPSLWWDDEIVRQNLKSSWVNHSRQEIRIFLSVGGSETEEMLVSKRRFEVELLSLGNPKIVIQSAEYPQANHADTVAPSFLQGIPFLFEDNLGSN